MVRNITRRRLRNNVQFWIGFTSNRPPGGHGTTIFHGSIAGELIRKHGGQRSKLQSAIWQTISHRISFADSLTPQSLGLWLLHIIDAQEGVLGKLRLGCSITSIPELNTPYQRRICVGWMKNLNGGFKKTDNTHYQCLTTNVNGQHNFAGLLPGSSKR
ncbi:N-acetyltransferase 9-like protein [Fusarium oxysporum f. sp. albedinis]|jgi:hypothetical protein|nr:N-acetyltransferase 9-like protein [Fusarium oxysporum f. sp. albedinis]